MALETETAQLEAAITALAREESGRVLAMLANRFHDVDLADESVQEALIEASRTWPKNGVPANPPAWLLTVARRKAIDRLRRAKSADRRMTEAAPDLLVDPNEPSANQELIMDDQRIVDDRLRMVFLCCHPALSVESQSAMTLRLVAGLTTEEIASAFLVPVPTLAQRISRAKKKVRDARIPLRLPDQLDQRVGAVLSTLYLIFNEGYLSTDPEGDPTRVDLCAESIRLTEMLSDLLPDNAEVYGLLALERFHEARRPSRFGAEGDLVLLADQDRTAWSMDLIAAGNTAMNTAVQLRAPGRFQLEAMIARIHTNARTAEDTDWTLIAKLYGQLTQMSRSPVIALNCAVAVAMADGPHAGLRLLEPLLVDPDVYDYHLLHSTHAELLVRAGEHLAAHASFERALSLVSNPAERKLLEERLWAVTAELNR